MSVVCSQPQFRAVNAFSNENGFKAAIAGVFLLFLFYSSVFSSGGIDGSNRVQPNAVEACDLESDPRCRY